MQIAFYTLGCKVNQYETEVLASRFAKDGFQIVSHDQPADVYVINSCTVTATSDKKSRQLLRRLRKQSPTAVIALTGCYPQAFPEEAERLIEADIVRGAQNRRKLVDDVKAVLSNRTRIVDILPHQRVETFEKMKADTFHDRTRAFVKIEDGCDKYCAYCIIPKARGPIRSKEIGSLKSELITLAQNGYQEIVLVGINLSSYGKECGLTLTDAVETACSVDGIKRVRLGSLEPELLTDEDLDRLSTLPKFCPQFHLSLQSGCSETLRRMNRHYTAEEYQKLVEKIRRKFENPAITTDIMVGFPGETEEEFQESLAFAKTIGFAKAHVFAYSRRKGTKADRMPDQLSRSVKEERSKQMIQMTDQTQAAFLQTQVGRTMPVLLETRLDDGLIEGYTPNYTSVHVEGGTPGEIVSVKVIEAKETYCIGKII